jgi:hypothetical protein
MGCAVYRADEIQGLEDHMGRAIAVGNLQQIFDVALGREREPFDRHRRARDIACHSLQFILLVRQSRDARMQRKAGRFRQRLLGAIPGQR